MTNEILSSKCYSSKWQDLLYKCHSLFTTTDPTKGHQGAGSLSQLASGKPQCTLRKTRRFTAGLTCEDKQPHTLWLEDPEGTYTATGRTHRDPSPTGSRTLLCLFFQHKKSQPLCSRLCVYANKYIYVSSRSVKNVVVLVHRSFAHTSFLEKKKMVSLPLLLGQEP